MSRTQGTSARATLLAALFAVAALTMKPATTLACSPPFEEPTIRALGPRQVVVLGVIGERVEGGRLFHVERWFNGGAPSTPIRIAFKEGEPIGDCSYPIAANRRLLIAPDMAADGTLSATLVTLQADPETEVGRRYVAEAEGLFGPGVVPITVDDPPGVVGPAPEPALVLVGVAAAVAALFASIALLARRRAAG